MTPKKTTLTKEIRAQIVRAAIAYSFKERVEAHRVDQDALVELLYDRFVSPAMRMAMADMIKAGHTWFAKASHINVIYPGRHYSKTLMHSFKMFMIPLGHVSLQLTAEYEGPVKDLLTEGERIQQDRDKATRTLDRFIQQFRSVEALREAWPEGRPVLDKLKLAPRANALVVSPTEVNKLLDLPKPDTVPAEVEAEIEVSPAAMSTADAAKEMVDGQG